MTIVGMLILLTTSPFINKQSMSFSKANFHTDPWLMLMLSVLAESLTELSPDVSFPNKYLPYPPHSLV